MVTSLYIVSTGKNNFRARDFNVGGCFRQSIQVQESGFLQEML
jgi:hypothetical protein